MNIKTTRFGRLDIEGKRVIHFPDGLLGFPEYKNYFIIEHKPGSPFSWLQSVDVPGLAFVMTDPFLVKTDYLEDLSHEERRNFSSEEASTIVVFVLVTILPGEVEKMTINLLGPLVIRQRGDVRDLWTFQ